MKIKNITLTCLFAILFFTANTFAQSSLGISFNLAAPSGDYANNVDHPMGVSVSYLITNPKFKGLQYGAELGVSMYANDSYDYEVGEEIIELDEEDCYLAYHIFTRYRFNTQKKLMPYVEGRLGGISYFSSLTTSDDVDFEDQHKFHGSTFSLGAGGGLLYAVNENLAIDFSAIAAYGLDTDYRSIDKLDPIELKTDLNAGLTSSSTSFLNFKLGILLGF